LKYAEEENAKLRNINRELRNEFENYEEENHDLENKINNLKEQLEDYDKLKVELDHTNKELMLTM
jgi:Skp family chaperone for outer membrane proteins